MVTIESITRQERSHAARHGAHGTAQRADTGCFCDACSEVTPLSVYDREVLDYVDDDPGPDASPECFGSPYACDCPACTAEAHDQMLAELAAERRNERWFEERGGIYAGELYL